MAQDNVFSGEETKQKLMAGVSKVASAVKVTLGAAGSNAILEDLAQPGHAVTNDGISIAERIVLADPIENIGRNVLLEAISRANKQGGDGSTTTCCLTEAILQEGMKIKDVHPLELKRSLDECLPIILKSIDDQTKPITVDGVAKVASISAEDEHIGALIQEVYQKIGKDGILYPDVSKTPEDHYTIGQGVKIEGAGLLSPLMSDIDDKGIYTKSVSLQNPHILITKQKIGSALQLEKVVNAVYAEGARDLVVFCDDIEATVVTELIMTRNGKAPFRVVVIKLPVLWKDEWFEDVGKMTGATVVDPALGLALKDTAPTYLGTCQNLVVDRYDTYLDGIKDIEGHVKDLEKGSDDDKIRAARLNTKSARLYVGAHSDSALSYKRLKVEDARNAAWQALHGGVVAGGGVALRNSALELPATVGGKILKVALEAPITQIMSNAGTDHAGFTGFDTLQNNVGYDAKTNKLVDMLEAGIVDPAPVTKNAITQALSVASTILTTNTVITLPDALRQQHETPR